MQGQSKVSTLKKRPKIAKTKKSLPSIQERKRKIMPRLDTLEMIEDIIGKEQYFGSKTKLWKALPRGVQYGTLRVALAYLEKSNKITQNRDGSIVWIFVEGDRARKSLEESIE